MNRPRPRLLFLALLAAVLLAFGPGLRSSFLNFDDDRLVYANPVFALPAAEALGAILDPGSTIAEAYLPASHLSLYADFLLFGRNPIGAHLHSLLLHVLAAWALLGLLRQLRAGTLPALGGALLFALHPALVESVAWASSRKDVLSGLLVLCSLLATLRWLRGGSRWSAGGALLLGLLAVYAKGTAIVLPLLAGALAWREGALRRSVPLLAGLAAVAALAAVHHAALSIREATGSFLPAGSERLAALPATLVHYARTAVFPAGLDVLHPPQETLALFRSVAPVASLYLAGILLLLAVLLRYRLRLEALGVLFFLAALLPLNGVVPASSIAVADRYLYLPLLGVGVLGAALAARWPRGGPAVVVVAASVLGLLSFERTRSVFRDSETLWRSSLAHGGKRPEAAFNLASFLLAGEERSLPEVKRLLARAAGEAHHPIHRLRAERLLSFLARAEGDRRAALLHGGRAREAALALGDGPQAKTLAADVTVELALLFLEAGNRAQADRLVAEALGSVPLHPGATAVQAAQRLQEVVAEKAGGGALDGGAGEVAAIKETLLRSLGRWPADLHLNLVLGDWHRETGSSSQALRVFHQLQREHPRRVEPYVKAADTYLAEPVPMIDGAQEELDKGLAACGQRPELLERKGRVLAASGNVADARRVFEDYLRLRPEEPSVRVALAEVLMAEFQSRMRREDARNLGSLVARAKEVHPAHPRLDFAQGVVLRAEGRFAEAVASLEQALAREPEDAGVARFHGETLKALGFSLLLAGRKDEALATFRRVMDLRLPEFDLGTIPSILDTQAKSMFERGISLFAAGDAAGAAESFRAARKIFPEHPDVLFNLGLTLIDLRQHEEAASLLELAEARLVAAAKDFGLVRNYRVLVLRRLGKDADAARLAEEFIAAHPSSEATPRLRTALHEMGKN